MAYRRQSRSAYRVTNARAAIIFIGPAVHPRAGAVVVGLAGVGRCLATETSHVGAERQVAGARIIGGAIGVAAAAGLHARAHVGAAKTQLVFPAFIVGHTAVLALSVRAKAVSRSHAVDVERAFFEEQRVGRRFARQRGGAGAAFPDSQRFVLTHQVAATGRVRLWVIARLGCMRLGSRLRARVCWDVGGSAYGKLDRKTGRTRRASRHARGTARAGKATLGLSETAGAARRVTPLGGTARGNGKSRQERASHHPAPKQPHCSQL